MSSAISQRLVTKYIPIYITLLGLASLVLFVGSAVILWFPQIQQDLLEMARTHLVEIWYPHHVAGKLLTLQDSAKYLIICIIAFWLITVGLFYFNRFTKKGFLLNWFTTTPHTDSFPIASISIDRRFAYFAISASVFVWLLALARATDTLITWDEAYTYLRYAHKNIFISSLPNLQNINNHLLNSLLIRLSCFLTGTEYNIAIIRAPNLLFACIYLYFSYRLSARMRYPYLIFIFFIGNYVVNEYYSLARGYAMASACMMATFYYFEQFRNDPNNRTNFNLFMLWSVLAAFAQPITLYVILAMLLLCVVRYHKNVFSGENYLAISLFLIAGLGLWYGTKIGLNGSSQSFWMAFESLPKMFILESHYLLTIAVALIYVSVIALGALKSKKLGDYASILLIVLLILFVADLILKSGYPHTRMVVPLYPLIVIAFGEAIATLKNSSWLKGAATIFAIALVVQFCIKIDPHRILTKGIYAMPNNVGAMLYTYEKHYREMGDEKAFAQMLQEYNYEHPIVAFYIQKQRKILNARYSSSGETKVEHE
ncbi:hypothetical protein AGMMS50229_17700 [Campylobacterota bacterium]|nr:hypothetical protein AGMMS50229_17700 [Campylobacterota bacterium]